ncbi:MAG: Na+/H+ antiporter NhaC family protein, partial [Ruminococcaceae bacterium]|nr:Na+/H+ antiporter NhaC family protein [Oscillospiraceae bacterium]
ICMIAPISSWAAAVSSYAAEGEGIKLFVQAIPYNLYSLLTLAFIIIMAVMKLDFGPMRQYEIKAENGDIGAIEATGDAEEEKGNEKGRVLDLVLPILVLVAVCVLALIYVGGFFEVGGDYYMDFVGAFGNTDATVGLPLGGFVALLFTMIYLLCRRIVNFKEATDCIPKGFLAMVPAILILTMATALKNMTGLLGAQAYVKALMDGAAAGLANFLPAIIFLVAVGLSFSTGTSWGTFGILIPIVCSIFPAGSELLIIGISACLAGSVCGDHCSPISDTTIMSSAGAQCDHVTHVSTQLPYALTVAAISFVGYLLAGLVQNVYIVLSVSFLIMLAVLFVIRYRVKKAA